MEWPNTSSLHCDTALGQQLAKHHDFWEYWGFVPWQQGPFVGVSRQQRFVKGGLLGTIAEYAGWDAIVWNVGTQEERDALWQTAKPIPDIMTQRYVFLVENPWPGRKIRSFAWGFRGYFEFYAYWPTFPAQRKVRDLTGLVDLALRIDAHEPTA